MPTFKLDEDSWPLIQTVGTWIVAVGLLVFEGVNRHFQDSGGITLLGGLLGLPVIVGFERKRREDERADRSRRDRGADTPEAKER